MCPFSLTPKTSPSEHLHYKPEHKGNHPPPYHKDAWGTRIRPFLKGKSAQLVSRVRYASRVGPIRHVRGRRSVWDRAERCATSSASARSNSEPLASSAPLSSSWLTKSFK